MRSRSERIAATMLAQGALALAAAGSAAALPIGSNLYAAPNGGVCPVVGRGEASCTFVQVGLGDGHVALDGVQPSEAGVVTTWKVSTGAATPATTGVEVRLRGLEGGAAGFAFAASPWQKLPLEEPGVHSFPARLPLRARQYLGLDTVVVGQGGGEAAAPLAYRATGAGSVWAWVPSLSEGPLPRPAGEGNLELLLNARLEPDEDRDGYGDTTQDRCPEDPRRHSRCDRVPPRAKVTYAPRQDFLRNGKIVVYVRANEDGRVIAGGQVDIADVVTWGIYSDRAAIRRGQKRKLVLRVPARARESAARSLAHGRRVTASVTAFAIDGAGNESGAAVAVIRPKR